ncbi:hypothetical protein ACQKWADRAFT_304740 [Trichoderma austrokoningii]
MSDARNNNLRDRLVGWIQSMDNCFWDYLQFRAAVVSEIDRMDAQRDQRRDEKREDPDMEDVVMSGTSPY